MASGNKMREIIAAAKDQGIQVERTGGGRISFRKDGCKPLTNVDERPVGCYEDNFIASMRRQFDFVWPWTQVDRRAARKASRGMATVGDAVAAKLGPAAPTHIEWHPGTLFASALRECMRVHDVDVAELADVISCPEETVVALREDKQRWLWSSTWAQLVELFPELTRVEVEVREREEPAEKEELQVMRANGTPINQPPEPKLVQLPRRVVAPLPRAQAEQPKPEQPKNTLAVLEQLLRAAAGKDEQTTLQVRVCEAEGIRCDVRVAPPRGRACAEPMFRVGSLEELCDHLREHLRDKLEQRAAELRAKQAELEAMLGALK